MSTFTQDSILQEINSNTTNVIEIFRSEDKTALKVLISNEIALNKVKLDELDNQMLKATANVARARTIGDRTTEDSNVSLMIELQDEIRGLKEFDKTTFAQRFNQARELDNELNHP